MELSVADLRASLSTVLPEYMVPSAYVMLDAFPLTPNGKLDRRALPAPDQSAVVTRAYEAPRGSVEIAIAHIWQDVLGLTQVGRHDHFFELGGHSLLATQIMLRIQENFHVNVPLRTLFEKPLLQAFANFVHALQLEIFLGKDMENIQKELDGLSKDELLTILAEGSDE